jgi:DNA repair protein RadC
MHVNYASLSALKGIKQAKAIEILSIVEISRRLKECSHNNISFHDSRSIYKYLKDELMFLKQEHFLILCLDQKNQLIKKKTIFIGSLNMSIVTPREVFKEAIGVSSAKLVLVHNHPSGNSMPSDEDIYMTSQFMELGDMMSIEVVDHVIIGWNEFYSIKSQRCFRE